MGWSPSSGCCSSSRSSAVRRRGLCGAAAAPSTTRPEGGAVLWPPVSKFEAAIISALHQMQVMNSSQACEVLVQHPPEVASTAHLLTQVSCLRIAASPSGKGSHMYTWHESFCSSQIWQPVHIDKLSGTSAGESNSSSPTQFGSRNAAEKERSCNDNEGTYSC